MAGWSIPTSPLPSKIVSKRNTLKFFRQMCVSGANWKPLKRPDIPDANVSFNVLVSSDESSVYEFASSVVRKLQRLQTNGACFQVEFVVKDEYTHIFELPSHLFRVDNILVQACMAEKIRAVQADVRD